MVNISILCFRFSLQKIKEKITILVNAVFRTTAAFYTGNMMMTASVVPEWWFTLTLIVGVDAWSVDQPILTLYCYKDVRCDN